MLKELVQGKLREWNLDKQFQQFFGAEEFDEFTFATLSEEEANYEFVMLVKNKHISGTPGTFAT